MNEDIDENEWLAQQLALSREHWAPVAVESDVRGRSYRLIARALRQPPPRLLPADFAARVAVRARAADASRFESGLLIVLVAILGVCAAAVLARIGSQWTLDARATGWLLAFTACVGGSWLMDQWRRAR